MQERRLIGALRMKRLPYMDQRIHYFIDPVSCLFLKYQAIRSSDFWDCGMRLYTSKAITR